MNMKTVFENMFSSRFYQRKSKQNKKKEKSCFQFEVKNVAIFLMVWFVLLIFDDSVAYYSVQLFLSYIVVPLVTNIVKLRVCVFFILKFVPFCKIYDSWLITHSWTLRVEKKNNIEMAPIF